MEPLVPNGDHVDNCGSIIVFVLEGLLVQSLGCHLDVLTHNVEAINLIWHDLTFSHLLDGLETRVQKGLIQHVLAVIT